MADVDILAQKRVWDLEALGREAEAARKLADAVHLSMQLKLVPIRGPLTPENIGTLVDTVAMFPDVQEAVVGLARAHAEVAARNARDALARCMTVA